jgi:hypothetical protein
LCGVSPAHDFPTRIPLSGVIICPAYWKGQRLAVNSFTVSLST